MTAPAEAWAAAINVARPSDGSVRLFLGVGASEPEALGAAMSFMKSDDCLGAKATLQFNAVDHHGTPSIADARVPTPEQFAASVEPFVRCAEAAISASLSDEPEHRPSLGGELNALLQRVFTGEFRPSTPEELAEMRADGERAGEAMADLINAKRDAGLDRLRAFAEAREQSPVAPSRGPDQTPHRAPRFLRRCLAAAARSLRAAFRPLARIAADAK